MRDGLLFTDLIGDQRPEQWVLTAQPQHGRDTFTIELASRNGAGLVVPEDEGEPVGVRPLIVMPTYPPRYPLNELFRITPVDPARRAYLVTSALTDGPRATSRAPGSRTCRSARSRSSPAAAPRPSRSGSASPDTGNPDGGGAAGTVSGPRGPAARTPRRQVRRRS
ncbi:I66 family serine proteinase inhibitor [Streptomyces albus]|nr:I66 family serine proteinase inhibitor [Streptomyces albus]